MLQEILIAIIMNLSMFIIVKVINDQSSQQTQNYFKDQLEKLNSLMVENLKQVQNNFMNEIATNKVDIMAQLKDDKGDIVAQIKETGDEIKRGSDL
jgi:flagellar biosynthesis protein FliP